MNTEKSKLQPLSAFAGSFLDRAEYIRKKADGLATRLRDPSTKILPLWNGKALIQLHSQTALATLPGSANLRWLTPSDVSTLSLQLSGDKNTIFLGLDREECAHFAIDISYLEEAQKNQVFRQLGKFIDTRSIAPSLDMLEVGILAQARSMLEWHKTHGFCACCGAATEIRDGGYRRHCNRCHADHFPRTDPVVIMLVYFQDTCLLGRKPTFPANLFSCLAGFIEPGESIEEAVAREVWEEANIEVDEISYISSQPWPFPSQLMIGCFAQARHTEAQANADELEQVQWFSRTQITAVLQQTDSSLAIPPPFAIAHQLIRAWAFENNK